MLGALLGWALLCGVAPDIDSYVKNQYLGHRTAAHTLLTPLLLGAVGFLLFDTAGQGFGIAAALTAYSAVVLHLAVDTINPAGIPWLFPRSFRRYSAPERLQVDATNRTANLVLFTSGLIGFDFALGYWVV